MNESNIPNENIFSNLDKSWSFILSYESLLALYTLDIFVKNQIEIYIFCIENIYFLPFFEELTQTKRIYEKIFGLNFHPDDNYQNQYTYITFERNLLKFLFLFTSIDFWKTFFIHKA